MDRILLLLKGMHVPCSMPEDNSYKDCQPQQPRQHDGSFQDARKLVREAR